MSITTDNTIHNTINPTNELFKAMRSVQDLGWFKKTDLTSSEEFKTIEDYNTHLVNTQTLKYLVEYIEIINEKFLHHDLVFMKEFLDLVKRKDFCIPHEMLQTYGIVTNIDNSNNIKKCLDSNLLIQGADYAFDNVVEQTPSGAKYKNKYTLTPKAFKKCLIRSKNSDKYANYYLALEEAIVYYNDYQIALSSKYIILFTERIECNEVTLGMAAEATKRLEQNVEKLRQEKDVFNKEMHNQTDMITEQNNKIAEQNSKIDTLFRLYNRAEGEIKEVESTVEEILPERVIPPKEGDIEAFVLMTIGENTWKAIRCKAHLKTSNIKKLIKAYPGATEFMCIQHPNARSLLALLKERVRFVEVTKKTNIITLLGGAGPEALCAAIEDLERERYNQ